MGWPTTVFMQRLIPAIFAALSMLPSRSRNKVVRPSLAFQPSSRRENETQTREMTDNRLPARKSTDRVICFLNGHRDPERHNSCGICGARRAPVSFAEYSGTAVSRFSTEFAPGERDANEREPARRTRTNWSALDDFRGRLLEGQVTPLAGWSGCAVVLCARKRTRYAHSEFCRL